MEAFRASRYFCLVAHLVAVLSTCLLLSHLVAAQTYLYNLGDLSAGNQPAGLVLQDFNHDGRSDLAVANFSDNTVSVILDNAGGTFRKQVAYATGTGPAALAAADFRNTGKTDLAVVNYGTGGSGSVSILLGNGDGTFESHVDYPVGYFPVAIVAGDFNRDGKRDLAVANEYDNNVSILYGNGDGTFKTQVTFAVGNTPTSLTSGDFNKDGNVDLAASCVGSGVVSVLLSNGAGMFTRTDSPAGVTAPDKSFIVSADFNGDQKTDVVISSYTAQQLYFMVGNGDGTLQAAIPLLKGPVGEVSSLAVIDANNDGKADLAFGSAAPSGFVVLLGNGNGTFRAPVLSPIEALGGLAVGDINGDGYTDLAATSDGVVGVGFYLGSGDGKFAEPSYARLAYTEYGPNSTIAADFNGDGKLDIAVAETNFPTGQISVILGRGNGTFKAPVNSPLLSEAINNGDLMLTGDFNGDGHPDLLVVDDYYRGFQVLFGKGNGTFHIPLDTVVSGPFGIAVGDVNSDGKTDVILTTNALGEAQISIYLSKGDGTFVIGTQYLEPYGAPYIADVNGDGKQDLVLISFGLPILVMLGNGDGTFQTAISGPSGIYASSAVIADLNGDGRPDIAVGTYNGLAFLQGNGDGTFQNPLYSNSTISFCCRMAAADLNGDGKPDLISNEYNIVWAMVGNGDGTFQTPLSYTALGQIYSGNVVVGDFNSDGVSDIGTTFQVLYPTITATVTSLNMSSPAINLYPTSLNFQQTKVGKTSLPMNVSLSNAGNSRLSISGIAVNGDFTETNNCGSSVAIRGSCSMQVFFKPTARGTRTGSITIQDNSPGRVQLIHLQGVGQ